VRQSVDDYVAAMTRRYLSLLDDTSDGEVADDEIAEDLADGD
jgi:hypothetical protein